MGKVFITDEVNDSYTADVTKAGKMKIETGAAQYVCLDSAYGLDSAVSVVASAAYLKSVIIGQYPTTAGAVWIYNTSSATMGHMSAFGVSGDNIVGKITYSVGAGSAAACALVNLLTAQAPVSIPFNVYCSSGIAVQISPSAMCSTKGCFRGVTVVYQTV